MTFPKGLRQSVRLNNGLAMPWLGLGVYQSGGDAAETASIVTCAIRNGYRSVDTAALYGNEIGVGNAVRTCGVPREEIFVTTKVWNSDIRSERVEAAFDDCMSRLGLEYVDLILLHWPIEGKIASSWKALENVYREGRTKAIGVSNYLKHHLEELLDSAEVVPAINQIEYHPYLQSPDLKTYCETKGIQVEAWSPFMHGGEILSDAILAEIGATHGKTAAQVILRWILQSGVVTIPKSAREERIIENAEIFDFELNPEEMERIRSLDRNARWGPDPASFSF